MVSTSRFARIPVKSFQGLMLLFILFCLTASAGLAGPGAEDATGKAVAAKAASAGKAVFNYASFREVTELNPYLSTDTPSRTVTDLIYEGLVKYSPSLDITPCLASSWKISDDQRTFSFVLRRGVKWHDGKPLTSTDIVYSIGKAGEKASRSVFYGDFTRVEKVKPLGDYAVEVTFDKPFAPAFSALTLPIIPAHVPFDSLSKTPVGTGPYRHVSGKGTEDSPAVLEYFEGWDWKAAGLGASPMVTGFVFHTSRDQKNILPLLLGGVVDGMELDFRQFEALKDNRTFLDRFAVSEYELLNYTFLGFNLGRPPFNSVEFRRAATMAIDREAIIRDVLKGHGTVATGPFPPGSWAANREIDPMPYDLPGARKLLSSSGFSYDGDRLMLDKDRVKMQILTNAGETAREETAAKVAAYLSALGIEVEVVPVKWKDLIKKHLEKKDFDAIILGWSLDLDPDCHAIWHSSQRGPGQFNFIGYSNPRVDKLLDEGRAVSFPTERQKIYREIHSLLAADAPCVFLYCPRNLLALRRKFEPIASSGLSMLKFLPAWKIREGVGK